MLCVSDLEEPFLPLPAELLVNLDESREVVEALLDKLPAMFANTIDPDLCLAPALQARPPPPARQPPGVRARLCGRRH